MAAAGLTDGSVPSADVPSAAGADLADGPRIAAPGKIGAIRTS
jgi:hypothetical protein